MPSPQTPLRRFSLAFGIAAGATAISALAAAPDRPPAAPTRDVAVEYRVDPTPPTVDTVAWLVAEGRVRTDGKGAVNRVAHVIDTRSGNVTALVDAEKTFHDLGPLAEAMTQDILPVRPGSKLAKEGADTVAGQPCTVWRIEPAGDGDDPDGGRRACVTADGVPLRLVAGGGADAETLYEATRVAYGPQDPARFRRPAGYAPIGQAAAPAAGRKR